MRGKASGERDPTTSGLDQEAFFFPVSRESLSPPIIHALGSLNWEKSFRPVREQWEPKQHQINQADEERIAKAMKIKLSLEPEPTKAGHDQCAIPKQDELPAKIKDLNRTQSLSTE